MEGSTLTAEITTRSDFDVDFLDSMGSDEFICKAARVSTLGASSIDSETSTGLINFLLKNRHGTPFEHGAMCFRITAPIFVWREFMRHRIGFSYNEESGRYKVLDGVFYIPPYERPLVQVGKPGHYEFIPGSHEMRELVWGDLKYAYGIAWASYLHMLSQDIAKEVARMCLPVATYSTAYVTCNPRSLMSFLSLRTKVEGSYFMSFPQWEINQVASAMENQFAQIFPITYKAFNDAGRVSP